jgi:hypothetical protein
VHEVPRGERVEPPWVDRERPILLGWLEFHRRTLEWKCEGLTPDQLCLRSVPPSSLSLVGLVRHMTDVERGWFRRGFDGEEIGALYEYSPDGVDEAFDVLDADRAIQSIDLWRQECAIARSIVDRHSLDDVAVAPYRGERLGLRWVVTHMIEEYARHNGHADFLRERIDGLVGE